MVAEDLLDRVHVGLHLSVLMREAKLLLARYTGKPARTHERPGDPAR
jgi:hypothetical protein